MRRARLILVLVALGCLGAVPVSADDEAAAPSTPPAPVTDPAQVAAHYRELLQQPEFHDSGEAGVDERLRDVLEQWFYRLGEKMSQFKYLGEMSRMASIMFTGMVVLCAGGVVYVIVRLCRRRAELDRDDAVDAPGPKAFRPPEFYEREIQEAVRAGDWHAAWLAAWRQFLSRLERHRLVEADRTRTNREYLAQLRARTLPAPAPTLLASMVDAYDRFIYGHQPMAESDWNYFQRQVGETGLLLHLEDKGPPSGPDAP